MTDVQKARQIRAKKLGILIRDARQSAGKSVADCAEILGCTADDMEAYELGDRAPSLPELELLAYYLGVPIEQFWSQKTRSAAVSEDRKANFEALIRIRQKMVGTLLRKARLEANISLPLLAESIGISPAELESYEVGEMPLPVTILEALVNTLNLPLRDFQDRKGPVGSWIIQQRAVQSFKEMPPELQAFVSKPINRPYLELAQRLSEMSVERLRAVAEGLLEITL